MSRLSSLLSVLAFLVLGCEPASPPPGSHLQERAQALTRQGAAYLVRDIWPGRPDGGSANSGVRDFASLEALPGGKALIFPAHDGVHGIEPWVTDGTETGTRMLADVAAGSEGSMDSFHGAPLGELFFFRANDRLHGYELWVTEGSPSRTWLARDIAAGGVSGNPLDFTPLGDQLLFAASGHDVYADRELWRAMVHDADGGTLRVTQVADLVAGASSSETGGLVAVGGSVYFTTLNPKHAVHRTDGGSVETVFQPEGSLSFMSGAGGRLYFDVRPTGTQQRQLWTFREGESAPRLLLERTDGVHVYLPREPPLSSGAVLLQWEEPASGRELWRTDGTDAGTGLIKDVRPGAEGSAPQLLGVLGGRGLFVALEDGGRVGLWRTDGTAPGTVQVKDLGAGLYAPRVRALTLPAEGLLLFALDSELWVTDGTPEGSYRVQGLPALTGLLQRLGERIVFSAYTSEHGLELWAARLVDITDRTPPSVTCPANVTATAGATGSASVSYPAATATDALSTPTLEYSRPSGSDFLVGTTPVTVTATDVVGNSATCQFLVTVAPAGGADAGSTDAGVPPRDAGTAGPPTPPVPSGCGCGAGPGALFAPVLALLMLGGLTRRRARRG